MDYDFIRSVDPLAQRDEWALLHQGKTVNATDFGSVTSALDDQRVLRLALRLSF